MQTPRCCVTSWLEVCFPPSSSRVLLCTVCCAVTRKYLNCLFSSFLFVVFASLFCHLFSLETFVTKSDLPRTTNFPVLSCCSVLLQHVCCFGFIFYPPRSPQEVWRVWWVASCFWVRDPPKARFFPPALSETTGVLRKLQNFSVCGAENDFLVNTV